MLSGMSRVRKNVAPYPPRVGRGIQTVCLSRQGGGRYRGVQQGLAYSTCGEFAEMAVVSDHPHAQSDCPADAHLKVLTVVRRIPPGFVLTYGRVADAADMPRRARWVGRILRDSPLAADVPWHRVVSASGRISDRSGPGASEQRRRLEDEGVVFDMNGKVDLSAYLWRPRHRDERA